MVYTVKPYMLRHIDRWIEMFVCQPPEIRGKIKGLSNVCRDREGLAARPLPVTRLRLPPSSAVSNVPALPLPCRPRLLLASFLGCHWLGSGHAWLPVCCLFLLSGFLLPARKEGMRWILPCFCLVLTFSRLLLDYYGDVGCLLPALFCLPFQLFSGIFGFFNKAPPSSSQRQMPLLPFTAAFSSSSFSLSKPPGRRRSLPSLLRRIGGERRSQLACLPRIALSPRQEAEFSVRWMPAVERRGEM